MADKPKINWEEVYRALNFKSDESGKQWRRAEWKLAAMANDVVSYQSFETFICNRLKLAQYFTGPFAKYKIVILKAHQAACNEGRFNNGMLHMKEFKAAIRNVRMFLEFYVMFDEIDTNDDQKISPQEFITATNILKKYGAVIKYPELEFQKYDTNKSGSIMFDEFLDFAMKQKLELVEDDD